MKIQISYEEYEEHLIPTIEGFFKALFGGKVRMRRTNQNEQYRHSYISTTRQKGNA